MSTSTDRRADVDEETLRSRKQFARRQRATRWLRWRYVVGALVALLLIGGATYAVYFSDALSVTRVEVVGASDVSPESIRQAADVPTGGPLATLDLEAIEYRVGALAAIGGVEVSRQWPDEVRIQVVEREAVAVVERGGAVRGVDAEGVVFGSFGGGVGGGEQDLPVIRSASDVGAEALREGATVIGELPEDVARQVEFVEVGTIDQITLALRGERTVRWGNADDSEFKGEVLLALLGQDASVYDVSVPGQPTTSG